MTRRTRQAAHARGRSVALGVMAAAVAVVLVLVLASLGARARRRSDAQESRTAPNPLDQLPAAAETAASPSQSPTAPPTPPPAPPTPPLKLTCDAEATPLDVRLVAHIAPIVAKKHAFITLATMGSFSGAGGVMEMHASSLVERAPRTAKRFVVFCAGADACAACKSRLRGLTCVPDETLAQRVDAVSYTHLTLPTIA